MTWWGFKMCAGNNLIVTKSSASQYSPPTNIFGLLLANWDNFSVLIALLLHNERVLDFHRSPICQRVFGSIHELCRSKVFDSVSEDRQTDGCTCQLNAAPSYKIWENIQEDPLFLTLLMVYPVPHRTVHFQVMDFYYYHYFLDNGVEQNILIWV